MSEYTQRKYHKGKQPNSYSAIHVKRQHIIFYIHYLPNKKYISPIRLGETPFCHVHTLFKCFVPHWTNRQTLSQNLEEVWCFLVREYFQDKKQNKMYKQTKLFVFMNTSLFEQYLETFCIIIFDKRGTIIPQTIEPGKFCHCYVYMLVFIFS